MKHNRWRILCLSALVALALLSPAPAHALPCAKCLVGATSGSAFHDPGSFEWVGTVHAVEIDSSERAVSKETYRFEASGELDERGTWSGLMQISKVDREGNKEVRYTFGFTASRQRLATTMGGLGQPSLWVFQGVGGQLWVGTYGNPLGNTQYSGSLVHATT